MKVRQGFVSNSSSSSFIIRGVKVKTKDIIKQFNVNLDKIDEQYDIKKSTELDSYLVYEAPELKALKKLGLSLETIRSYFDGDEAGEIIIGQEVDTGCDGEVKELSEFNDEKILESLKKAGIKGTKLRTYLQYVSNDNY